MKRLTVTTIMAVYLLIVFGGFVSSSGSGMGCGPDWPLCNGAVIPLLQGDTLIEFAHRVIGAVIVLLVALLARRYFGARARRPELLRLVIAAIGLLLLQVILGAITVFYHLPAAVTTIHLGVAMVFLAVLILFAHGWEAGPFLQPQPRTSPAFARLLLFTNGALLAMIVLGGAVKHTNASIACDWLDCYGSYIPTTGPQWLQTSHRLGAFLVAGLVLWVFLQAKKEANSAGMRGRAGWALFLVVVQIVLGIVTVSSRLQIGYAVAHLAVATALFAVTSSILATEVLLPRLFMQRQRSGLRVPGAKASPQGAMD